MKLFRIVLIAAKKPVMLILSISIICICVYSMLSGNDHFLRGKLPSEVILVSELFEDIERYKGEEIYVLCYMYTSGHGPELHESIIRPDSKSRVMLAKFDESVTSFRGFSYPPYGNVIVIKGVFHESGYYGPFGEGLSEEQINMIIQKSGKPRDSYILIKDIEYLHHLIGN